MYNFRTGKIIRRYDEVLIGKASKHSVYEVEKKCKDDNGDYFDRSKKIIKDLQKEACTNHQQFEDYKNMMSSELGDIVKDAVIR